jgi:hypothetical protein
MSAMKSSEQISAIRRRERMYAIRRSKLMSAWEEMSRYLLLEEVHICLPSKEQANVCYEK